MSIGQQKEQLYECPYCGNTKVSPNGTGSDVACCGEVGHSLPEIFGSESSNTTKL